MSVLKTFWDGRTVGEAYQEVINENLIRSNYKTDALALRIKLENTKRRYST